MRLSEAIRRDRATYGLDSPWRLGLSALWLSPFWLIFLYRLAHWCHTHRVRGIANVIRAIGMVVWGAEIWPGAEIGPGFRVAHPVGVVIGSGVHAGRNLMVFSGVVLGSSAAHYRDGTAEPTIGDDVTIYAHAVVAGGIRIGDGVVIRAGSVVLQDVHR
jgi:serine O-acetyltransferase